MALNKAGVAAIVAASTVATIAAGNQIIGGIILDTPCTINAEVVAAKFKYFQYKHKDADIDPAVSAFFKAPRGAKLIATLEGEDSSKAAPSKAAPSKGTLFDDESDEEAPAPKVKKWKYEYIGSAKWKVADKKAKKDEWKGKGKEVLQDWEAVNKYLEDHKAAAEIQG